MMSGDTKSREGPQRFGMFGGRYVPEVLWTPFEQVASAYYEAVDDEQFCERRDRWTRTRVGRPTPLTRLEVLSDEVGGATIWAKREDLCQGGTFCITSALVQTLVADEMGKSRIIGETATGDFGVALGSAGAALGMGVLVFMGREAIERQQLNVARMRSLGVELVSVEGASTGRSHSMAEALRTIAVSSDESFYATSSLASPAPYPTVVGDALSVIGDECSRQVERRDLELEYVVAPVGSGSFAAGLFSAFLEEGGPQVVGVQAGGGEDGERDAASLVRGRPGVHLGTRSLVLQDEQGQIEAPQAEASGVVMPLAGPQHARWLQEGRVHYVTVPDLEARRAQQKLVETEGISASRETGYGLAYALKLAPTLRSDQNVVIGITGTGLRSLGNGLLQSDGDGSQ